MSKETDYLFEMYKKYAPTKMVGNYECETNESNKWLDNIIIAKKKTDAFDIMKDKDVNPIDIRCCDTVKQYNVKENGNIPLTEDEFDLLKEVLL